MKKIYLILLMAALSSAAFGQATSLSEDFNASCSSAMGMPADWKVIPYHYPTVITPGPGDWTCNPSGGEIATPGISCTNDYTGTYHLDTSILVTPLLDLTGYTGNIYLRFDTKTSFISGEKLSVIASNDSLIDSTGSTYATHLAESPIFSSSDSSGWVTHEVNLTPFKATFFYVAFEYTGPNTYGTQWFIDNVNTTTIPLHVPVLTTNKLSMSILGSSTSGSVGIAYTTPAGGDYSLSVYDEVGRLVFLQTINAAQGSSTYTIGGFNLHQGMYFVRMSNGIYYCTAKAIIP